MPPITRRSLLSAPLAAPLAAARRLEEAPPESLLGSIAPVVAGIQRERGFPMSWAARGAQSPDEWRRRGRAEVQRTLSYVPKPVPLDVKVHATEPREGYELRTISFAASQHYRVPAFLLVPTSGKPPYPALAALHDHGGFFYFGKEKLVEGRNEHASLEPFRAHYYAGRPYASEFARRGFVVIVIDAFYWGERRVQYRQPPPELAKNLQGLEPSQPEYVRAVNRYLGARTAELNTWLSFSGTNWLGIVVHDDRRSLDVLASLPEVDRTRLGCVGLSGGGYRSTYLSGMDPRVRAAVIAGWMTSLPTTVHMPYSVHSDLFDADGLHANLDHPDVASLAAPDCATFVQSCARDRLFTRAGMESAIGTIQTVYRDLKKPEHFSARFYDVPHQFNLEMQEDALAWLSRWLKR